MHRADYYRLLQEVREQGAWEAWLEFFLEGVETTAGQAVETGNRIVQLFKTDRERIGAAGDRGSSTLRIHELIQTSPFITALKARERTGLTLPTINSAIGKLQRLGIVQEVTGRKRGRVYSYRAFIDILSEGSAA